MTYLWSKSTKEPFFVVVKSTMCIKIAQNAINFAIHCGHLVEVVSDCMKGVFDKYVNKSAQSYRKHKTSKTTFLWWWEVFRGAHKSKQCQNPRWPGLDSSASSWQRLQNKRMLILERVLQRTSFYVLSTNRRQRLETCIHWCKSA